MMYRVLIGVLLVSSISASLITVMLVVVAGADEALASAVRHRIVAGFF